MAATGGQSGEAAREVLFVGVEEVEEERKREEEKREWEKGEEIGKEFVAHAPLPDKEEIECMFLDRKKELLSKYASYSRLAEEEEAKEILNVQC
jgi:pre-mRNA-splicing factor ISY1